MLLQKSDFKTFTIEHYEIAQKILKHEGKCYIALDDPCLNCPFHKSNGANIYDCGDSSESSNKRLKHMALQYVKLFQIDYIIKKSFIDRICIPVTTYKESRNILDMLGNYGVKWSTSFELVNFDCKYHMYHENTCYILIDGRLCVDDIYMVKQTFPDSLMVHIFTINDIFTGESNSSTPVIDLKLSDIESSDIRGLPKVKQIDSQKIARDIKETCQLLLNFNIGETEFKDTIKELVAKL